MQQQAEISVPHDTFAANPRSGDSVKLVAKQLRELLYDETLADETKWMEYSQLLQRYLRMLIQKEKPITLKLKGVQRETQPLSDEQEIIKMVPDTYRETVANL